MTPQVHTDGSSPQRGPSSIRVAEFFAGIGLVRLGMERAGFSVVFANDIAAFKREMYEANFGEGDFVLDDIRHVNGSDVPTVDIATASFPCTDLSLAGGRRGLAGSQSGLYWEFLRVLNEMGKRQPPVVLIENVPSFGTSRGGEDLRAAVRHLNSMEYSCDIFVMDAREFLPQSRPRLFIVATKGSSEGISHTASPFRPPWLERFIRSNADLNWSLREIAVPDARYRIISLNDIVEDVDARSRLWWDSERVDRFVSALSPSHSARLSSLKASRAITAAAAFRRTRGGAAVWEIRNDALSGCLRATRGGSSKQALVIGGGGRFRVRWMTAREYASLQGADSFFLPEGISENQAQFGFGDAVCVPVIEWIARNYVTPLLRREKIGEGITIHA